METPTRYKCLLCGRDKFTHKTPHKCIGGFRKRGIKWEEIYEEKEVKNKLKTEIMTNENYKEANKKLVEIFKGLDPKCEKTSFIIITANESDEKDEANHTTLYVGKGGNLLNSIILAMLQDEALFNLFYNSIQVVVGELLENNLFSKNGSLKKGALEKLLKKIVKKMIIDEK